MVELALSTLLAEGLVERIVGDADTRLSGIKHDSRRVEPGDMFAALPGVTRDGTLFIGDALARGASCVLSEHELALQAPLALSRDALVALAAIAQRLYADPTAAVPVVGVTGTNGKTTTTYLVEQMLLVAGHRPAVIGTINVRGPAGQLPATHTTPMADDMMRLCRWAVDSGATELVLEVSSHALAMHRADGVHFAVAAFTNLSQDHLDYHGDLETYGRAKRRLFDELSPQHAVINVDDALGARIAAELGRPSLRCSRRADAEAELRVLRFADGLAGLRATVATPAGTCELESPLCGEYNLENLLVALGCGLALGLPLERAVDGLRDARGAPGRLERVAGDGPAVFVDYAHTPDALERVLRVLRPQTRGRLWVVFGCGGDRDRTKRPPMGRAAVELADLALATSDNPRSEDPERILDDVEQGMTGGPLPRVELGDLGRQSAYARCADRRRAIELAIERASDDDIVLIAGKGHEAVQIIGARREAFDDVAEAGRALAARGSG